MNIMKSLAAVLCVALAAVLTACSSSDDEGFDSVANAKLVYFSNVQPSVIELDESQSTFKIPVLRLSTEKRVVSATSKVSNPNTINIQGGSSVVFEEGSTTGYLTYSYDATKVAIGHQDTLTVTLDPAAVSPYGAASMTFLVGKSEPWRSLGKGFFRDKFMAGDYYEVEIEQSEVYPNHFRIVKPYDKMSQGPDYGDSGTGELSEYLQFEVLNAGDDINGFAAPEDGTVAFTSAITGYHYDDTYGDIFVVHPAYTDEPNAEELIGESYVTSWQEAEDGADPLPATIQLGGFYGVTNLGVAWDYSGPEISIVFPGVVMYDYASVVDFAGTTVDYLGNMFAKAEVSLGEDVEYADLTLVKYVFDEEGEYAGEEIANKLEHITSGTHQIAFPDLPTGIYYLYLESYNAEDDFVEESYTDDLYFSDGKLIDPDEDEGDDEGEDVGEDGDEDGDESDISGDEGDGEGNGEGDESEGESKVRSVSRHKAVKSNLAHSPLYRKKAQIRTAFKR